MNTNDPQAPYTVTAEVLVLPAPSAALLRRDLLLRLYRRCCEQMANPGPWACAAHEARTLLERVRHGFDPATFQPLA